MSNPSRIPAPRPTALVAPVNGALPGATCKVQPDGRDPAVAARLDALDARIWAEARRRGDPQLAVAAARDFAREVFVALILRAGDGRHGINCSVAAVDGGVGAPADLPVSILAEVPAVWLPGGGADEEIRELIALAHVSEVPGVLILRTHTTGPPAEDGSSTPSPESDPHDYTIRGWRIAGSRTEPMDAAGMFAFCCSEATSGEPLPIHPGTRYADALALRSRHDL